MGVFETITKGIKNSFDKRAAEKERIRQIQKDIEIQRQQVFEEEYRKNAFEVAKTKALRDAAKLSGLQKLRAENRARRLTEPQNPMFKGLSEYTQRNIARREQNLARTKELRETAKRMREEQMAKRRMEREARMLKQRPFVHPWEY